MPERRPSRFSAVRSPVRIARSEPRHAGDRGRALEHLALVDEPLELDPGIERPEDGLCRFEARHDARGASHELRRPHRVHIDGRIRGDVTAADVLRERRLDDALQRIGGYSHVSSSGPRTGSQDDVTLEVGSL